MVEVVFGDPLKIGYPGSSVEEKSPETVVVGMLTRAHANCVCRGLTSFVIMFQPAGLSVLFPVDLRELTDRDYNARAVVGKPIAELEQRLLAMDTILARNGRVRIPEVAARSGIGNRRLAIRAILPKTDATDQVYKTSVAPKRIKHRIHRQPLHEV
jgi:hypothetical protein